MASTHAVASAPPTEGAPGRVPPTPPPPQWSRRLLVGVNVVVAVCLVAAGLVYAYVSYRDGQINRIGVSGLLGEAAGGPQTILIVGSDSRANLTGQDAKTFGVGAVGTAGQRSDTIMLLHLDPATKSASLMSIPRDLWVPIPGTHHQDRINTTFNNGPDLLVRAIHDELGITVNHYMAVDFNSFRGIVNSVGAVRVYFPTPARDVYSGLDIRNSGCWGLSGDAALSYVRARHFQYYVDGSWHTEGLSDLARIRRQQDFIKRVMGKAISAGFNNPIKLNGVLGSLVSNLTVDSGFHLSDMVRLAKRYRSFTPAQLQTASLPTDAAVIGGADVLTLHQPDAQQAIGSFLGAKPAVSATTLAPVSVDPANVHVQVLNGSGRNGQAASVATSLRQYGMVVTGTGRADSYGYGASVVQYTPGQDLKARYLQAMIIGGARLIPVASLGGSDLALITGSAYSGLQAPGTTAAPASPATTASPLPATPANAPPCPA